MVRCRNNIVLVKRDTPKKVTLPNGRTFYAKYRRVTQQYLPGGITIGRTYKGRPVQGRRPAVRASVRAKPANAVRPSASTAANANLNIAHSGKARSRAAKGAAWRMQLRSGQRGRDMGDVVKSVANNPFVQDLGKKLISKGISSIPFLFKRGIKKIKNKHLRKMAQSDIMSDVVKKGTRRLYGGIGL